MALAVSACATSSSNPSSGAPSTIAPGSPWTGALSTVTLPAPVNSLTAVDCAGPRHCWAVGSTVGTAGAPNGAAVITTADGGSRWTAQPIPATVGYLSDISCSNRHYCAAVGQATQTSNGQGAIITTSDGGATWTAAPVPTGILDVTAVACQPNRRCLAIGTAATGSAALVSSPSRPGWVQQGTLPPGLTGATDISCPDSQHCWVTIQQAIDVDHVAGQVALTTDGGATWATTAAPKAVGYLNGIACFRGAPGEQGLPFTSTTTTTTSAATTTPQGTAATAPGSTTTAGSTTTSGPSPTTTAPPPPATTTTTAPAGLTGAWCVAVGTTASTVTGTRTGRGVVLTTVNGGASWTSQPVRPTSAALMGISCTAVSACVGVGSAVALAPEAGLSILTGPSGHPWRRAATVSAPQALTSVSCVSTSACVLVGESISEHLAG